MGYSIYGAYSESVEAGREVFIPQCSHFYVPRLKAELDITQWISNATEKDIVYIQVWRNIDKATYRLLGQQKHFVREIGKQQVYPTELIHVLPGDILGFYIPYTGIIPYQCRNANVCDNYVYLYLQWDDVSDIYPGSTYILKERKHGWGCQCVQYPIQAIVRGI